MAAMLLILVRRYSATTGDAHRASVFGYPAMTRPRWIDVPGPAGDFKALTGCP